MEAKRSLLSVFPLELRLTLLVWVVYLLIPYLVVPEHYQYSLAPSELVIKASFLVVALFNNYVLIPRFLHKSRYWQYAVLVIAIILAGALFDEMVLEHILFPDTRGARITLRSFQWAVSKVGFVVILFSSFKLIWDYQQKQKQMNELEKEKIESELKFLKSQINPHVLFNILNNIYSYALDKSEKVPDMLLRLSEIMRYMLREGENHTVLLEKEISYLKNFIELQKLRLEERGTVLLEVEGEPNSYEIAPLLLVSFVENSFKHSMRSEVEDIEIVFRLKIADGILRFESKNTFSENNTPEKAGFAKRETGIGLQNVQKRLRLIYGDKHELNISRKDKYFIVSLTLDLNVHETEVHNY